MSTASRNERCPCGSGKKYKHCCLGQAEPATTEMGRRAHAYNATERAVFTRALAWTESRLGPGWLRAAIAAIPATEPPREDESQFLLPWLVYHYSHDGPSPAEQFLAEPGSRLTAAEREALTCNLEAHVSIWEVRSVEPGVGVELFDLLTHTTRFVHEVRATRTLQRWAVLLASVVSYPELSVFACLHPRMLLPAEAAGALAAIKRALHVRTRAVPAGRLRVPEAQLAMLRAWRDAVREGDARATRPLIMNNTDGDPLVLCTDHFDVAGPKRDELLALLLGIAGADHNTTDDGDEIVFARPGNKLDEGWDNTIVGRAVLKGARLLVETNSVARADALRRLIEQAAGKRLQYRLRDVRDLGDLLRSSPSAPRSRKAEPQPSAELQEVMRQVVARHYEHWLDEQIPALGGNTPRQAASSVALRPRLIALLKELEMHEGAKPEAERYEVGRLWQALSLDPHATAERAAPARPGGAGAKQSAAPRRRGPRRDTSILELGVSLRAVEPPVWRRVRVRSHITLAKLHQVLQTVMGWTDSHLHEFECSGVTYGEPDREFSERQNERLAVLAAVLRDPGDRLVYTYDFGDGWRHDVVLERVLDPDPSGTYPYVTGGGRACPPEDCGGPGGYANLLEALASPEHPEHAELADWAGESFDPEGFDAGELNRAFHGGYYLPTE